MELKLNIQQTQNLSLKQALSVTVLQLGQSELCELLEKERLENPVIEQDTYSVAPQHAEVEPYFKVSYQNADIDFLNELNGEEDCKSLAEHIFLQIKLSALSHDDKINAATLCGFLEKSGYILSDVATICSQTGLTATDVNKAIKFIQTLDPSGVGARSLSECLLLQINTDDILSQRLAKDFLPQIANGKLSSIATALKISLAEVEKAVRSIKSLNPKPGFLYGEQAPPIFVVPDVIVTLQNSEVFVALSKESAITIKISNSYSELLKNCTDKDTVKYLGEKLEKARWLQQCIENRSKTLLLVATAIVRRQEDFFLSHIGTLKPLKLRDISGDTSLHESTVSRAVKDKYLQCGRGILPLKQLFSGSNSSTSPENGEAISSHTTKEKITVLIKNEDPLHPLSDQRISNILKADGILCSRRTVAKYRDSMGIASTNHR